MKIFIFALFIILLPAIFFIIGIEVIGNVYSSVDFGSWK